MQKVTLVGYIGRDIESKTTQAGKGFHVFPLAVNVKKDTTVWYDVFIPAFRLSIFEKIIQYLTKGKCLLVHGDLDVQAVSASELGGCKAKYRVTPDYIQFISSKAKEEGVREVTEPF